MAVSSTLPRPPFPGVAAPAGGSRELDHVEALPVGGGPGNSTPAGTAKTQEKTQETTAARDREQRLRSIVYDHADFVARVLRNAGTPAADIDDDVQRAFIVVSRRLDEIHPGAEKSFLLRTALNLAAHARRTVARRREVAADEAPESDNGLASPERIAEQRRYRLLLDDVLSRMEENLRTVFVLYEFEEMSMAQIATALEIPAGTVASRLRRAREDFRARVKTIEGVIGSEDKT
jgi:RNA polymerase sigma-70 factor, ECF subfamily